MKYSVVLLAVAGLSSALKIADYVPECAVTCLEDAIKSGTPCSLDDDDCICEDDNYRNTYTVGVSCVLQSCGNDVSTGQVLPGAARFCEEVLAAAASGSLSPSASLPVSTTLAPTITSTPTITSAPTTSPTGSVAPLSTTSSPAGAATMGSIGTFGMLVLGAMAAF